MQYGLQELKVSLGEAGWQFTRGDWPAWKMVIEASGDDDAVIIMVQPSYFGNQVTIKVHGNNLDVSTVIEADRVMRNIAKVAKSLVAGWKAANETLEANADLQESGR